MLNPGQDQHFGATNKLILQINANPFHSPGHQIETVVSDFVWIPASHTASTCIQIIGRDVEQKCTFFSFPRSRKLNLLLLQLLLLLLTLVASIASWPSVADASRVLQRNARSIKRSDLNCSEQTALSVCVHNCTKRIG